MTPEHPHQTRVASQPAGNSGQKTRGEISGGRRGRWLVGLCVVQFALLIVLSSVWNRQNPTPLPQHRSPLYSLTNREPFFVGRPGPWGELEFARINIEPPDEFIPEDDLVFPPTLWFFPDFAPGQLTSFFQDCGLTDPQRAELSDPARWQTESNGIVVAPSTKLILELSPAAHAKIYPVLARADRNTYYFWPFTYRSDGFDDWFRHAGLSPATLDWLKRLVYRRGAAICFSDLPELLPQIPDTAERKRLVKALFRNATLLMKVRIRPDTDVKALTAYWGGGRRSKDIAPLLESLTEVEGSITIDVAHLLPAFARKRLYTYPLPEAKPPDCFWTVMNFFNDPPDDRYHDETVWSKELADQFVQVTTPACGDVIFLLRPDNVPIHAAVYIADDAVFSKNGGHLRQPWVLMKMADMLARYPEDYEVRVVVFRRKTAEN